ncbi:MAG TPA: hypothetical protein VGB85_32805 [Nannocystis sp.]|jgi:hypothetical protein
MCTTILLSIVTLGVAAKTHGRQIRRERERAGYTHVTFGGDNPPFVTALWRRDRQRLWTTATATAFAMLALIGLGHAPASGILGTVWSLVFLPMLAGFALSGLASSRRAARSGCGSCIGGFAWWSLLSLLAGVTIISALCPC